MGTIAQWIFDDYELIWQFSNDRVLFVATVNNYCIDFDVNVYGTQWGGGGGFKKFIWGGGE